MDNQEQPETFWNRTWYVRGWFWKLITAVAFCFLCWEIISLTVIGRW